MSDQNTKGEKNMAKPIADKFPKSRILKMQNWQSGTGKQNSLMTQNDL